MVELRKNEECKVKDMGDRVKNVIMDIVKTEEIREYFDEILREQTQEIVSLINTAEVEKLRIQLSEKETLCNDLKRNSLDLEESNRKLQSLIDDRIKEQEEVSEKCREFEKEISVLQTTNQQLSVTLEEEKNELEKNRNLWETEKSQMLVELDEYKKRFLRVNSFYNHYLALPENIKQRLGNIFPNENIYSMIVAICNWNCIEGLWEFTKRRIIEEEYEGLIDLVGLFMESFNLFAQIEGNKRYELITPSIGEQFDSDRHSIKGTKTDGIIEKVLLSGIQDSLRKKIIFKAFVQLK